MQDIKVLLSQACNELHNSLLVLLAINKVPSLNHGNKTILLPFSPERLSQNWSGCSLILLGLVIEFNLIYKISTKCLFSGNVGSNNFIFFQPAPNVLSIFLWLLL